MLQLVLPAIEMFDESKNEFIELKEQTLQLEHSLVSLSKWESKWCKPFLGKEEKSYEESIDYIKCMTLTQNVKPETYSRFTKAHIDQVYEYINAPMTATTFNDSNKKGKSGGEVQTAEIIYYYMITLNIPMECQKWHLNRLLTLIRVCEVKSQPAKKMSKRDIMSRNAALNAARRQQLNTKG